jgi:hypothetical protein
MSKKIREKRSGTSNGEIQRHTSTLQNSNTVNLDEDGAEVSHKQPTPDEARTELRIKPRKKRGLLMVSERNSVGGSSSKSVAMKAGPSTNNCISSSETRAADASRGKGTEKEAFTSAENNWTVSGTEVARTASQRKQTNRDVEDYEGCHPSSHIDNSRHPGEDDGLDKTRCLGRPSAKARRVAKPKPAVEHVDNHATEPYVVETMRRLRPNRQLSSKVAVVSNGFGEVPGRSNLERREHNVVVDKMPAPRLAKLGRKSIRSREVIGFIFDEEQDPIFSVRRALDLQPDQPNGELPCQPSIVVDHAISAPKAHPEAESGRRSHDLREAKGPTALQRQNSRTSKPLDNEASPLNHNEEISSTVTTATVTKQPVTRIANPATRGKRAAKPSDAAGQMPTCPLATEPPGRSSVHQNPSMTDVPGSLSKGTAGPMPGFIRANGGPWSREAHDLFDFKRPL